MGKRSTFKRSERPQTVHENSTLRRENGKLRKQIQRLNSLLQQYTDRSSEELLEEFERKRKEREKGQKPQPPASGVFCPKCDGEMTEANLGRVNLLICPVCKYREKK